MALDKTARRKRIRMRIRKTIKGDAKRPRLSVYRSNKDIYAQLIDDEKGTTLASASSNEKSLQKEKGDKKLLATLVGKALAEKAKEKGIKSIHFDRGGYLYHGRVKALADGVREGGIIF